MRHTRRDLTERKLNAGARGLVRRLRVAASKGVLWLLEGHEDLDGNLETDEVEVFPGVGLYARPKAGHRVEAIVLKVGGESGHPVIVATRNQDGIRVLGELDEDETAVFTSKSMIKIQADGTILAGSIGGTFEPLVRKSEFDGHGHEFGALVCTGGTVSGATAGANSVDGTSKLRG